MVRDHGMAKGCLCISIDLELAWGTWDKPSDETYVRCNELERVIVEELVKLMERYEIAATWAIVGSLADTRATNKERIWYAPELVELLMSARVAQDIGSHGYAHIYFGESDRASLRHDLAEAKRVHDELGLPLTSFVFPRNQVAHVELLKEIGVRVYRSVDRGWHIDVRQHLGTLAGRVANLADKVLPVPPAIVSPIDHDGLTELPSSMLLLARNGLRRAIRPTALISKALLGLELARRGQGVFHLWFHPSNFYYDMQAQLRILETVLRRAADLRDRELLSIEPMSAFAS